MSELHEAIDRIEALRVDLLAAIQERIDADGYCKSYEGMIKLVWPSWNQIDNGTEEPWTVELHCYLIGPSRHYDWTGATPLQAVQRAENDIRDWIDESREEMREEREG
jgi:hypothetical protein